MKYNGSMWHTLRERLVDPLTELIFPRACLVCSSPFDALPDPHAICPSCRTSILEDPLESCPRCSGTVGPFTASEDGSAKCRDDKFAFDRAFRLGPYDGLLKDVVLRMKHAAGEPLAETMGHLWATSRNEQFLGKLQCRNAHSSPLEKAAFPGLQPGGSPRSGGGGRAEPSLSKRLTPDTKYPSTDGTDAGRPENKRKGSVRRFAAKLGKMCGFY